MREEIVRWTNTFPLDRWWRKKYNIPYMSSEHRNMCQIDIYLDWLEEKVLEKYNKDFERLNEKKKLLEEGILLTPRTRESKISDSAFDEINLDDFY